jgi:hypothetical protein
MDDLNLQIMTLREEVARLLCEKRELEERIVQLTPRAKCMATIDPRKHSSALYWVQE